MAIDGVSDAAARSDLARSASARWQLPALVHALADVAPDCAIEVVPQMDSTNSELMRRLRVAPMARCLLVAERQTAGRGRLGRVWHSGLANQRSSPDDPTSLPSLTFSVATRLAPKDWSGLSLAVGVSVAAALHPALGLKWPNDIWFNDRKLAGILIETAANGAERFAVVGVGINITQPEAAGLFSPATCLRALLPDIDAPAVLLRVAPALLRALDLFESRGFAPFQAAFGDRDVLRNRPVQLSDGTSGTACGVDERGALLVHTPEGMTRVNSAEVSVRPVPAPDSNS